MELHTPGKPTAGRIVLFHSDNPQETGPHSGTREVPAIITYVWGPNCINLMVMRDGHGETPVGVTSVTHSDPPAPVGHSWRWPPRV